MDEEPALHQAMIRIQTVGEEKLEARFSNHVTATLEKRSMSIFITFAQAAPLTVFERDKVDTSGEIPTFDLAAPAISRIVMPIERFKEWIDSVNKTYDAWFGGITPDEEP